MNIYDLEYSEAQGVFHYNNGTHPLDTNGFVTIATGCNEAILDKFIDFLNVYFEPDYHFTLKEVQDEWDSFINSLIEP